MAKYKLARTQRYNELKLREKAFFDLQLLRGLPREHLAQNLDALENSRAQLGQDVFALSQLGHKRDGFFVEFGATDGIELNNTYMLETEFGWTGILAEPDTRWHANLKRNRTCAVDTRCVYRASGETVRFTASPRGENSGISTFSPLKRRLRGTQYDVTTISLNDLLAEHNAPEIIDYASVDTEGSEFVILEALDFSRWQFRVLSIEHNFAPQREQVFELMCKHGYQRVYPELSRFDDWYIHPDLIAPAP